MPISAAAKRLKYELEHYGNPPKLPPNPKDAEGKDIKYQYEIMAQVGIPEKEIANFT